MYSYFDSFHYYSFKFSKSRNDLEVVMENSYNDTSSFNRLRNHWLHNKIIPPAKINTWKLFIWKQSVETWFSVLLVEYVFFTISKVQFKVSFFQCLNPCLFNACVFVLILWHKICSVARSFGYCTVMFLSAMP